MEGEGWGSAGSSRGPGLGDGFVGSDHFADHPIGAGFGGEFDAIVDISTVEVFVFHESSRWKNCSIIPLVYGARRQVWV